MHATSPVSDCTLCNKWADASGSRVLKLRYGSQARTTGTFDFQSLPRLNSTLDDASERYVPAYYYPPEDFKLGLVTMIQGLPWFTPTAWFGRPAISLPRADADERGAVVDLGRIRDTAAVGRVVVVVDEFVGNRTRSSCIL